MPADIPKYALRPHSFERLAHPVQHIAGARRAPALLCVVFPVPRFIARTILDESRLVFCRCLASEANIRKTSLTTPELDSSASSRGPTNTRFPCRERFFSETTIVSVCMYRVPCNVPSVCIIIVQACVLLGCILHAVWDLSELSGKPDVAHALDVLS